jgi:hypothetical protein
MSLTARDLELLEKPTIAEQMPIQFDNGFRWTQLSCNCFRCGQAIADEHVKGMLVRHNPQMVVLEAIGSCASCNLYTRFLYRLYDDKRIMAPRKGRWVTWQVRPATIFSRTLQSLRRAVAKASQRPGRGAR